MNVSPRSVVQATEACSFYSSIEPVLVLAREKSSFRLHGTRCPEYGKRRSLWHIYRILLPDLFSAISALWHRRQHRAVLPLAADDVEYWQNAQGSKYS